MAGCVETLNADDGFNLTVCDDAEPQLCRFVP